MGDIETEEPGLSTWPHKLSVPGRIDATDTDIKMVMMDPTDVPKQRGRLNQAGRRARANRIIRNKMDYKRPDENHEVHIRRDTPRGAT